ncbi:MAG: rhodanese-related sulfurtransferase [Acidobacteriota bacterium]|nr:MAG: rhodanese-related sulfurtransferase [Acidobacteriota bacterium]
MSEGGYRIAAFYEFRPLEGLDHLRQGLLDAMERHSVRGTLIIAKEGFNGSVSGPPDGIDLFLEEAESIFGTALDVKNSFHDQMPFKRRKVKIKREIVTLRKAVDLGLGEGTHVEPEEWNRLISDPETLVLDTRNDYEVEVGRFKGAVDPSTASFSELPDFIERNLDPSKHKRIAMYCTGGIRCEKFAPYLRQEGFGEVYQLRGGILKYLETVPKEKSLWEGECFVFDERVSVDGELRKGDSDDPSYFKNRSRQEGD